MLLLHDRPALQWYFDNHAPRMREDGMTRFPGKYTTTRRICAIRETVPTPLSALSGVVYEVNLTIDADTAAGYDGWLTPHVAEMTHFRGFTSGSVLLPEGDARTCTECVALAGRRVLAAPLSRHARCRVAAVTCAPSLVTPPSSALAEWRLCFIFALLIVRVG